MTKLKKKLIKTKQEIKRMTTKIKNKTNDKL
jgi:hypothetical protein